MNWRLLFSIIFRKPAARISLLLQLVVMAFLVVILYTHSFESLNNRTFQTFITLYLTLTVFMCYIQCVTSIRPEDSRDLENVVVLAILQVVKSTLPLKHINEYLS